MSRYDKARFRITPVPAQALELPPVASLYGEFYGSDEAMARGASVEEMFEVYPDRDVEFGEVYLELYALELDDSRQIMRFVERYGVLGVHSLTWGSDHCHNYMGFPRQPNFPLVAAELDEMVGRGGRLDSDWECEAEFRFGAECLRDMTNAWLVAKGDLDLDDVAWFCPCWENSAFPIHVATDESKVTSELTSALRKQAPHYRKATPGQVLYYGMEDSLKPFSPTIRNFDDEMLARPDPRATPWDGELPLFSVLCLELFNHIVEEATYKRCANETCGRYFVRQRGRSQHGQHRTRGVKYCSAECARMQASRQYRRRKAAAK